MSGPNRKDGFIMTQESFTEEERAAMEDAAYAQALQAVEAEEGKR